MTVAKSIDLKDKYKILVLNLFKMLSIIQMKRPGWHHHCSVPARCVAKEGFEKVRKFANPAEIRRGVM